MPEKEKVEMTLSEYIDKIAKEEAKVIRLDIKPPAKAPYLEPGTELFNIVDTPETEESVGLAFGGRPNVPVVNVIRAIHRDIGTTGYQLHISDRSYTGYTIWEVWRYITYQDATDHMRYYAEVFDCDDFAEVLCGSVNKVLRGIPFGIIWYYGSNWGHAVNIFYCYRMDRIFLIEPQTDRIYYFNKAAWSPGMIII